MGKKFVEASKKVDSTKKYSFEDGIKLAVDTAPAKFDESIDVAVRLGIDPKQSDQQVRGAIALPHGLGKTVRVVVFAKGPKENEAKAAGADYVGAEDLVEKINGGWLDFDKCIASPDMMATVSKVAKVLGPRGLMPNPKVGTVTMNVGEAVTAEKKGKLDFRVDKAGIVHVSIGRKSMGADKLKDNFNAFIQAIVKAKPATSKGTYLRSLSVASTMGPGIKLDANQAMAGSAD
ncbi:50S ribosomal protein L1 [Pseudobdellovibrio exovorus]|uniref:Large ribosomal subunit protein uL1 n=1 Tax=Pseudobdellovibrio exovorus JSS TaxID=1184267 RepID=M4VDM3_9BACT|nr:50S ribosomal protein L1 [Pseudobdellovibrio exovorus]AGH96136.1 50S ribosomal protein L1 [Pseudobdellovibrio exovorus JSS]